MINKLIVSFVMATSTLFSAVPSTCQQYEIATQHQTIAVEEKSEIPAEVDLERFFFVPYESGSIVRSTYTSGIFGKNEVCIGVFGVTTNKDYSGIQDFCENLSNTDPEFAGYLIEFASWSNAKVIEDIKSENSKIVSVFKQLDETDHERFLKLQLASMESEYQKIIKQQNAEWILDCSPALVGSYYSMLNWLPYAGWENAISKEKEDKQNLISLYALAFEKSDYMAGMKKRWENQMVLAMDMLYGEKTEEDINSWMVNPKS